MFVMKRLENVAEAVKLGESKEARKQILRARLNEIVLPTVFKLPLNPHRNVSCCYLIICIRLYAIACPPRPRSLCVIRITALF